MGHFYTEMEHHAKEDKDNVLKHFDNEMNHFDNEDENDEMDPLEEEMYYFYEETERLKWGVFLQGKGAF